MLSVGSAVIAGKNLGEKHFLNASNIFSKTLITILIIFSSLSVLVYLLPDVIVKLLGAKGDSVSLSSHYLSTVALFLPFLGLELLANQFVRVDGRPAMALTGMIAVTLVNIGLDALFIWYFNWGIKGAAMATGIAYMFGAAFIFSHFFSKQSKIKIILPFGSWKIIWRASFNGISEFLNETSSGLVMLIFNWIMIVQAGESGVAAFTVVNYLYFIGIIIFYGSSEGVAPLISVNYGARRHNRIMSFLGRGIVLNLMVGIFLASVMLMFSEELIKMFLDSNETESISLALEIIILIWPAFLFSGINISFSGYFTGIHLARQSAIIALSRSLVLPVILIGTLGILFGYKGAFIAIPISEALTLIISIILYSRQRNKLANHKIF